MNCALARYHDVVDPCAQGSPWGLMTRRSQLSPGWLARVGGLMAPLHGLCPRHSVVRTRKARAAHLSTHSLCKPQATKPPVPCSLPCLALCQRSVGLWPHTGEFQLMVFQARRARRALLFGRHPPLRFVVLLLLAGVPFPVFERLLVIFSPSSASLPWFMPRVHYWHCATRGRARPRRRGAAHRMRRAPPPRPRPRLRC